ncbi:MAG: hypothetical protein KAH32_04630 [Chlamydiia bacterium]|nr:hypothetical protein [Chlamydiia bacterium]
MPIKLNFVDEKIQVDVNFYQVEEFVSLKTYYGNEKKLKMNQVFLYIYYMYSLDEDNAFRDLDGSMKKTQIVYRIWKKREEKPPFDKKELPLIEKAIDAYLLYSAVEEERIVEGLNRKMEQIRYAIDNTTPKILEQINPNTGITSFVSNVDILNKAIEKLPVILEVKEKLIASMKRQNMNTRNRGGVKKTSFREKGLL